MGAPYLILCDRFEVPLPATDGPIDGVSGTATLTELDQFSPSQLTVSGDNRKALLLLNVHDVVQVWEQGVGKVASLVIEDPEMQIVDTGGTITLTPPCITDQLAHLSVGPDAVYETTLGEIVRQIGATPPSGRTVTVYNTTTGAAICYVAMSGATLACYDPQGNVVANFPGPILTNVPIFNAALSGIGFVSVTATGVTVTDGALRPMGTFAPTYETTGWSAAVIDDGSNVLSAAPVQWSDPANKLTIAGNNLRKQAGTAAAYDAPAVGVQQIGPLASGQRADGVLSWQAADGASVYLMGLAAPNGSGTLDVQYGFNFAAGPVPLPGLPQTGLWTLWERGATPGPSGTFTPGTSFSVTIDYSGGGPVAKYAVNGATVYTSLVAVALPLVPLAILNSPLAAVDNAIIQQTVLYSQQWYAIKFEDQTPLAALLALQQQTGAHLRQGWDGAGAPQQRLEFGNFGTLVQSPRLMGAEGGDVNAMAQNPAVRVVTRLDYARGSSGVYNTLLALGADTGATQVNLERCYELLTNPLYPNFGKVGAVTGSVFPEYEPNYAIVRDKTRGGHWQYYVRDLAAFAVAGNVERRARYSDPQFQYADTTVANQEFTARALYVAAVAKLKYASTVQETLSVELVGAFRPVQAGNRVAIDFKRIGNDTRGNFAVMNTQQQAALANPFVLKWDRTWDTSGRATDAVTLGSLMRQPGGGAQATASTAQDVQAIKIVPTNREDILHAHREMDVDANPQQDHSLIVYVRVPSDAFRFTAAPLDIYLTPFRQQVTTAANPSGTPLITADIEVSIATPNDLNAASTAIAAIPEHTHKTTVISVGGAAVPTTTSHWIEASNGPQVVPQIHNTSAAGLYMQTNPQIDNIKLDPTAHIHPVAKAKDVIAHIPAGQRIAALPEHEHPITPALNDTTTTARYTVSIDGGTGQFVDQTAQLLDTLSNATGGAGFSGNVSLADLSPYFAPQIAGKLIRVKITPLADSNLGLGHILATGYWVVSRGGLSSQILHG